MMNLFSVKEPNAILHCNIETRVDCHSGFSNSKQSKSIKLSTAIRRYEVEKHINFRFIHIPSVFYTSLHYPTSNCWALRSSNQLVRVICLSSCELPCATFLLWRYSSAGCNIITFINKIFVAYKKTICLLALRTPITIIIESLIYASSVGFVPL